ncbi:hypothetical protein NDN08_002740 [Rhodosorus marinus]|uniref:RING-type domain-containing protein n=1 Tax=Rhodosorus marinus TaxID=101924 RepID=A0AAV8UUJ4_9RHOD|nr:hypothetical protein NDN08_002740 [Rhodosorus marinus]
MPSMYFVKVMWSRFSYAAQVFCFGNSKTPPLDFATESVFLNLVNNLMLGILLIAVIYILAHFLLTLVIVSRLFLFGYLMISGGSSWLNMPVEWQTLLNKQCPNFIQEKEEPLGQCSVCLDGFKVGCSKRRLKCSHEFHSACIEMWFRKANRCPLCLQSIVPCLHDQILPRIDQANRFWR